jgi:hypothetical protein
MLENRECGPSIIIALRKVCREVLTNDPHEFK